MRKSAKLCLYLVVLAAIVGGTAMWATSDKAVAVSIDGQARTIHTRSATIGAALSGAHIGLGEHDVIAPSLSARVHDDSRVVIRRGRLLHLDVDGRRVDVWTTASTVDEALSALGYGTEQDISVSRSARLPLTATQIRLLTPKIVTLKVDGKSRTVSTTAGTVRALIVASGVKLRSSDKVSAAMDSALKANQVVVIKRVRVLRKAVPQVIPFSTTSTDDPTALTGTTQVITPGKNGARQIVYQLVYVDGKLAGKRVLTTRVVTAPVDQQQKVGTKAAPTTAAPSTGASTSSTSPGPTTASSDAGPTPVGEAQAIAQKMALSRGWGGDQFGCLVNLWNRESGWNTQAANSSGAYGIPQALPGNKMASAGADWQTNATTQITWGLGYIGARWGNPCGAWANSQAQGWY